MRDVCESATDIAFPLHRTEEFGSLSAGERTFLRRHAGTPRKHRARSRIREAGVSSDCFLLLRSGWAMASHIMPDGGRYIVKVHLPGDALGTSSMAMNETVEELTAITDVVVTRVPLEHLGKLFEEQPRMAARILLGAQLERVALMDRLASLGRTSAAARAAALILDLEERLTPLGLVDQGSFEVLLTQEHIADLLGITAVHVNRVLRELDEQGLISRIGRRFTVLNRQALEALAQRPKRQLRHDPAWLPQPRS